MKLIAYSVTLALSASTALAADLIVGLGQDDVFDQTDTQAAALVVEYHADPFWSGQRAAYGLAVAGQVDGDGDLFFGIGVAAKWGLGSGPWYVEASYMPAYYDKGSGGSPLGGNLQFRTLLGLGYELSEHRSISIAVDHKSNGGIEDQNPGGETLAFRYRVVY